MVSSCKCLLSTVTAALVCSGCAANNTDMLHFLREHKNAVSAVEYRVGIPDTIGISAPQVMEIDGESQGLQPDGKINLRLLGEVKLVGMTAKEIAAKLEVLLSRYYTNPKVSVRVLNYASKKYYVYSEGGATGPRPYTGRDTLLDAVLASGVNSELWTSRVTVTRPAHGETPVRTIRVDIDRMLKEGDWSQNILLEPNDIVYIPLTPGAWMVRRVQEVLYPVGSAVQAYAAPAYVMGAQGIYANGGQNTTSFNGSSYGGGIRR